jgi:hypothetical protein
MANMAFLLSDDPDTLRRARTAVHARLDRARSPRRAAVNDRPERGSS